ncbi:MAG: cell division protein FtsQ/DivIB [Paludibacteraceae bacterium]|nr:cell division protein FtsQ/DivIB [Paludibacteraceae bacterium]
MATKINWRKVGHVTVFILIVAYLSASISVFALRSDERICSSCRVMIEDSLTLRFVSKKEVLSFLEQDKLSPLGVRGEMIDPAKIEKSLENKSRIKKADCYITPSGRVNISIYQREPILRVMTEKSNYYVDRDGEVMRIAENFAAYVPVVTGCVTEKFAKGELYEFALFLHDDAFWNAFVEQIDVNEREELIIIPRVGNQIVKLGKLEGYQKKLEKLYQVYKNGFNKLGWNCYKEINLMYEGQVVCTKK